MRSRKIFIARLTSVILATFSKIKSISVNFSTTGPWLPSVRGVTLFPFFHNSTKRPSAIIISPALSEHSIKAGIFSSKAFNGLLFPSILTSVFLR